MRKTTELKILRPRGGKPGPTLGWKFTPEETADMEKAIRLSCERMEDYGKAKGAADNPCMVGKSHYID